MKKIYKISETKYGEEEEEKTTPSARQRKNNRITQGFQCSTCWHDMERIIPRLLQPQVGTKTNLRISCRSIEGLAHRNHNQLISKIHNISS